MHTEPPYPQYKQRTLSTNHPSTEAGGPLLSVACHAVHSVQQQHLFVVTQPILLEPCISCNVGLCRTYSKSNIDAVGMRGLQ